MRGCQPGKRRHEPRHRMVILAIILQHSSTPLLNKNHSQKYNMVYKRTLSVITNPQAPPMFITPSPITRNLAGTTGFLAADARSPKPPKRRQPQDEESEMALFRRVRIKTEFSLPAPMKKCSWDPRQDRTWMEARARRLNWDQIQQAHFPSKSPMIVGDGTNP
jgi:hypothetical protein